MNCGKSIALLTVAHNYEEKNTFTHDDVATDDVGQCKVRLPLSNRVHINHKLGH